jgi:hypothetical protein
MHDVTSCYTKYYNKHYQKAGHLFQSRYKATLIEKRPHELLRLSAYMHRLPGCLLGLDAEAYPYSSWQQYAGAAIHPALSIDPEQQAEVLRCLDALATREHYVEYVHALNRGDLALLSEQLSRRVIGSEAFRKRIPRRRKAPVIDAPPVAVPVEKTGVEAAAYCVSAVPALRPRRPAWWVALPSIAWSVMAVSTALMTAGEPGSQAVVASLPGPTAYAASAVQGMALAGVPPQAEVGLKGLEGSTWEIRILPKNSASSELAEKDVLLFSGNKVSSRVLASAGVDGSNYTVKHQPDGSLVWETMQTGKNGEVICWRGEWRDSMMRGIMTKQARDQAMETFNFMGVFAAYVHSGRLEI